MRWFRSNIGLGSRLALFALAIQFALSFGHVHIHRIAPALPEAAAPADGFTASMPSPHDPLRNPGGEADPDCSICALIQLASISAPAGAPALPAPDRSILVRLERTADVVLAAAPHFLFQARAPPSI